MKCALCTHDVTPHGERYVCKNCSLSLPEALVTPKKRPIITHFEEREQ